MDIDYAETLAAHGYLPNAYGMWSIYNYLAQRFESFDDPEAAWVTLTTTGAIA